jgi:outer membrane protein OmpA-like peptidoglycan-associated protein
VFFSEIVPVIMKKLISTLVFFYCFCTIKAQQYNPEKVNPSVTGLYEKAIDFLKNEEFEEAVPILLKSITLDSNFVDAYLTLGGVFGQLKQYKRSVQFYEKARQKDAAYFSGYNLPYSINLAGNGQFKDALHAINQFLSLPDLNEQSILSAEYRKKTYQFALNYAAAHTNDDYKFAPINLGDSVNTEAAEYYPSVTITDSLLVFTRRGDNIREDFFQSTQLENRFSKASIIDGDINLEEQKGAITVSQDGEWMLFAGNFKEGFGNFDIYISYYTPEGWSEPQNLGENINTDAWESSPTLSPDKRALYFSSNRPGGYGGSDIYVSYLKPNGSWSPAQNMGPAINSAGDDQAPFIHADNQTLYFTSDGLTGYGGTDLYILRKNDVGEWGLPENLGYPINTIENEGSLAVSADGLTAYYASDRNDSRGSLDIYKFDMRPDIRPSRTLYVKGFISDKNTGKKLPSSVELIDNSNGHLVMKVQTDESGEYFVPLPIGKDYTFSVNRKGYFYYNDLYDLESKHADSVYNKDIALQPIELNASLTFRNIHFASNSFQLPADAYIELEKMLQVLNENPTIQMEISGHTDNIGKPADNLLLSANRAKTIVNWLSGKGIDAKRLSFKGYGETKPISENKTEPGRALNRRTTATVIGI